MKQRAGYENKAHNKRTCCTAGKYHPQVASSLSARHQLAYKDNRITKKKRKIQ